MRRRLSIKKQYYVGLFILLALSLIIVPNFLHDNPEDPQSKYPALSRPLAKEAVLIVSAGQSTDAYIIKDISNKLMLDNYFMPQATGIDFEDINAVAIVIGSSEVGYRIKNIQQKDEVDRINKLILEINKTDIPIITIFMRGNQAIPNASTDMLLQIAPHSDYFIVIEPGINSSFYSSIAAKYNKPISIVEDISAISEPYVSAFR